MMSRRLIDLLAVLAVPAWALQAGAGLEPTPGEASSAAGARASLLQTEAEAEEEADSGATVSMSTFSATEWKAMRKALYEEPFVIELDMTAAHEGMNLGADFFSSADTKPLAVQKVGEVGLVEKWNKAHPDQAVQVGDELIKVRDLEWARSNKQLVQDLKENFNLLKQQGLGAERVLQVGFQRPRHSKSPVESPKPRASLLQTEADEEADSGATASMSTFSSTEEWKAMRKAHYEEPFVIELDMAAAHEGMKIGADLFSQADTKPLAVQNVVQEGLVEKWNKAHPDQAVQVGDEFIKVSEVEWAHSNRQLVQHLKENFDMLKQQSPGAENVLKVSFQRPRGKAAAGAPLFNHPLPAALLRRHSPLESTRSRPSLLQVKDDADATPELQAIWER